MSDTQMREHLAGQNGDTGFAPASRISVLIPARNEAENLPQVLASLPDWAFEVVLVDGHSSDNTVEVARQLLPSIRVVHQRGTGKGSALREGFAACRGDAVIAIDGDGSMDPAEIEAMVQALESGMEYVKGSRMLKGGGSTDLTPIRRLGNWFLGSLANLLYGSRYTDLCYGFFGFKAGTIDHFPLESTGFEIETEINVKAQKANLRTLELPSFESPRLHGTSNLHPIRDGIRIIRTILRNR